MKYDEEDWVAMTKKFAVCDTAEWDESRLYWNVEIQGWVNFHNERNPCTLFDTFEEATSLALDLNKFVAIVWTDR